MNIRQSPSYSSAGSGIQPRHLTDYLRVIYKRRWTAALALVAVFVYSAMGILKQTPIYEASSRLLIEKEARRATTLNSVLAEQEAYYDDDFYPTQREVLLSRGLAWKAVVAMGLDKKLEAQAPAVPAAAPRKGFLESVTDWVQNAIGAPKKIDPPPADENSAQAGLVSSFLGGLSADQQKGTRIFTVRYRSADPAFAQQAANALVKEYINQTMSARSDATAEATSFYASQLAAQAKEVAASEQKLQQFLEANGTVAPDDKDTSVLAKGANISALVVKAQSDRIQAQGEWTSLDALRAQGREALETFPAIVNSPDVQAISADLRKKTDERTKLALTFQPKSAELQAAEQEIRTLTARKYAEEDKIVQSVQTKLNQAQALEQSYKTTQSTQDQEALGMRRKGIQYAILEREVKANRALYDELASKSKESGVAGQYKGTNIQVMDKAETPQSPVLPQTQRELMIAFIEGCVLALGLVFGFEYLDSRIKTPDELKSQLGLSFLGIVPVVPGRDQTSDRLLLDNDAPPGFSEALRAIRTSIIFSSADEGARAIVITSTAPGEGKTLVSTNLAVALAHAGQRTIIIDGDMRRPRTHEVFDRPQEPGLSNVLVGTARLRDAMRMTNVPNLFLLPAGHIPPNPAELLGSTRYIELLDELRQEYDWVLIDAPPVMAVTDAAILANTATGVVFVVGAEMTSRRNALAAIEQLTTARAKFIGAVLNRVDVQRHSYYYAPYYRKDYAQAYERVRK